MNVERRYNALGELVTFSEAIVKVKVGDDLLISAAEGDAGPVNALDIALRRTLGRYQSLIGGLRLVDYKVRIFQGGTDAQVTRVVIGRATRPGSAGPRSVSRQHHRRLVPGTGRLDHLQAGQGRRDGERVLPKTPSSRAKRSADPDPCLNLCRKRSGMDLDRRRCACQVDGAGGG